MRPVRAEERQGVAGDVNIRVLRDLTREQRLVFVLRYDGYMTAREIGDVLQMPVPRVWAVLREARVALRDGRERA